MGRKKKSPAERQKYQRSIAAEQPTNKYNRPFHDMPNNGRNKQVKISPETKAKRQKAARSLKSPKDKRKIAKQAQKQADFIHQDRKATEYQEKVTEYNKKYGLNKIAPKARGRNASVKLTPLKSEYYSSDGKAQYNPQSLRNSLDMAEMRKEYSRLRPVAMKRLARLEGSDFKDSQVFKYFNGRFPMLGSMGLVGKSGNKVLSEYLTDMNRFLGSELSTISGQTKLRNERINTLRTYGYEVNWQNFQMLTDVLDYIRDMYQDLFFDSDQLIQDALKYINEAINDPNLQDLVKDDDRDTRAQKIGDEVFERYAQSSFDLRELNDL